MAENPVVLHGPETTIDQSDYDGDVVLTAVSSNTDDTHLNILLIENKSGIDDVLELKQSISPETTTIGEVHLHKNTHVKLLEVAGKSDHVTSYMMDGGSTLEMTPEFLRTTHEMYIGSGYDSTARNPFTITYDSGGEDISDLEVPEILSLHPGSKIQVVGATNATTTDGVLNFQDDDGNVVGRFEVPDLDTDQFYFDPDSGTMQYACFLKGTHIATPDGEIKVENLKAGDTVITAKGGVAIVKWLGYRTLYKNRIPEKDARRAFPILFKKGSIAENVPHRDLIMSPGHHVFFDGNLIPAMALVNGKSIVQQFQMQSFQYFHVELEQFDILLAEGVPAESYVDTGNRNMFQNAHEVAMNPDFGPTEGRPDIPEISVVRKGPVVEAIRARFLERANWMQMPEARKRVG